ncbi:hypothetical protein GC102_33440 [Paenibacillus sp. LMG 31460]|uniref:Uncharacterized protein n=1 Tax=Paenibacillus germinis TaxID=2654979 RepID=A0ABX1ZBX2_9BACL|nr:hypothetical protein [Paenibacillus germinis]NOU90597.1 hypothetical protein [Paenibacillus germinis]
MVQKIMMLIVIYIAIFAYDFLKLKNTSSRERLVYGMLMIAALYPSLIYALELRWPNLDEWFHFFLKEPAKRIVESVKLPS